MSRNHPWDESEWRIHRLVELYISAKNANGGNSLSIYGEVSECLDALETGDERGIDQSEQLFGRLRELGGDIE